MCVCYVKKNCLWFSNDEGFVLLYSLSCPENSGPLYMHSVAGLGSLCKADCTEHMAWSLLVGLACFPDGG